MDPEEKRLCKTLMKSSPLKNIAQVRAYEKAASKLAGTAKPDVLHCMLNAINDNDAGEAQYALVEAIEASPPEVYIRVLLNESKRTQARAPFWYRLMFTSALNTPEFREFFIGYFKAMSNQDKAFLLNYVDDLIALDFGYKSIRRDWASLL